MEDVRHPDANSTTKNGGEIDGTDLCEIVEVKVRLEQNCWFIACKPSLRIASRDCR